MAVSRLNGKDGGGALALVGLGVRVHKVDEKKTAHVLERGGAATRGALEDGVQRRAEALAAHAAHGAQ